MWFYAGYFFLLGLVLGSFYNVVGMRAVSESSFHQGRSKCPSCGSILSWYELIPVLSYVLQLGKCRTCRTGISAMYPLVELSTGFAFVACYLRFGFTWELLTGLLFVSMLVIVLVADVKFMIIPDRVLLFFLPLFIGLRILSPLTPWYDSVIGFVVGFALIAIIILVTNGGMGAGDMKLLAVMGVVAGWDVLAVFFYATFIGAVSGLFLLWTGVITRKDPYPFGPSLVMAGLGVYLLGNPWWFTSWL